MSLFQPIRHTSIDLKGDGSEWKHAETRKRLAFGILRADVFTSVLLNTAPLLSFEEMNLTLPCSEDLWHNRHGLPLSALSIMAGTESRQRAHHIISDTVRILLDQSEKLPEMGIGGYELSLFCLQSPVWKFSHDPEVFTRLTGKPWNVTHTHDTSAAPKDLTLSSQPSPMRPSLPSTHFDTSTGSSRDALGQIHRVMRSLCNDRERVTHALQDWYNGFTTLRQTPASLDHRDSLMSSLLLWHTLNLQLEAPLQHLHDISYRTTEQRTIDRGVVNLVQKWAQSDNAVAAARRSCTICGTISDELKRASENRACFNFLAFSSLHHVGVILWTVTQATEDIQRASEFAVDEGQSIFRAKLAHRDVTGLLQLCANLLRSLSPLGGASFGLVAERLTICAFPLQ